MVQEQLTAVIAQPDAAARRARLAVATVFCVNGAVIANWIARIPDVKAQLGLSEGTLGLALLCMAIGALLSQPTTGYVIGRIGSRQVTIITALAFCVAMLPPAFALTLPLFMLSLFVLGAANGSLDVAMNAQAALVERHYARPIMSSFHGLWSVGGLIGAALGGLAASRALPLSWHFVLVSILATGIILVALRGLWVDEAHGQSSKPAFALPPRRLLALGIIAFAVLCCEGAVADWSGIYLRESLGSPPGLAASGYAAFALTMAIGRFTGDWLTQRFGPRRIVIGGGVLMALGASVAMLGGTPAVAIVGFACMGAGLACAFPILLSVAARTPGIATGTAIAAMATAGYTGFLVGPPLIGALAEAFTLRGALWFLALLGALVVLLSWRVQRAAWVGA
jgi:MFS family permease